MTSPPPFPAPIFQTARRISGHVVSEIPPEQAVTPTNSVAGNILLMEEAYYSLQRKIKDSMHGSVRVGFELNKMQDTGVYELVPNVRDKGYKMMTVQISRLQEDNIIEETINEVAALQWITNAAKENCHLLKPVVVGKDATHMYVISPYHHKEGSLFDYCGRVGRLSESEARFFFRQILQGLEELRELELCHRGLDLDSVLLNRTTCVLSGFDHALRIPVSEGQNSFIGPQEPHGKNPQSVAPELLKCEAFDGNAVDLWSAGVMLFQMLLGGNALFDAPIPEDPKYDEICLRSNLKGALQRWMPDEPHLSAEAIDLLEKMLKATPQKRLTLSAVQNHPWVKMNEVSAPQIITDTELIL